MVGGVFDISWIKIEFDLVGDEEVTVGCNSSDSHAQEMRSITICKHLLYLRQRNLLPFI